MPTEKVTEDHTYISASISISTIEGDPPEIEEDKDFTDTDCDGNNFYIHNLLNISILIMPMPVT